MIKRILITACIMAATTLTQAQQHSADLIEVVSFGHNQPIGVTVAPTSNRLFVSFPHRQPYVYGLTEIVNGERVPFPDAEWNKFIADKPENHFVNVQDLYADDQNNLWVLDSAPAGASSVFGNDQGAPAQGQFKLIQVDLGENKVKHIYTFDDLPKDKSALNDMCIDNSKHLAYLSDPGLHAIVVLDLKTGLSRVVLQDDKSTTVVPGFKLHLDGKDVIDDNGKPFTSNVNGIALTKDNKYFYFRAINQTKLYRILTADLANTSFTDVDLSAKVEMVAETGVCHGMIADTKGNIYLSDSPDHAIKYVTPNGKVHFLVKDERLIWPDSFGIGRDGYLYFSCSQVNRLPKYNGGQDMVQYPFAVYKVKMP